MRMPKCTHLHISCSNHLCPLPFLCYSGKLVHLVMFACLRVSPVGGYCFAACCGSVCVFWKHYVQCWWRFRSLCLAVQIFSLPPLPPPCRAQQGSTWWRCPSVCLPPYQLQNGCHHSCLVSGFPLTWKLGELRKSGKFVGVRGKILSVWATVAVILFQARSVMSYFGLFWLDFYYLFCYF